MEGITIKVRVVFSGEINVGKTAFITRETKDTFHEGFYQNTIGVDFVTKEQPIGKDTARVQLWDMAGGERKYLRLNTHYRGARALCLCFSLNDTYSFQNLHRWIKGIEQMNLDCPFYLIGCKSDLQQTVPQEDILNFAEKQGLHYFKCSAKEDKGVKQNFRKIVQKAAQKILSNPELKDHLKIVPKEPQSSYLYCHV